MEFRQLELFLAVIEEASVTRAAEKNHLSPGAVSLQMHSLADHLQTELFIRRGKHLVPTPGRSAAGRAGPHGAYTDAPDRT